jgi:GNAT superfamily N-acetyltransferase
VPSCGIVFLMKIEAKRVQATEIDALRQAYRAEAKCQIIYDSFLPRWLADAYALSVEGNVVGYGALANRFYPRHIVEFYLDPEYRIDALEFFRELLLVTRATHVRAQTNMPLPMRMLFDTTKNIAAEKVLFSEGPAPTQIPAPDGMKFRHITEAEAEEFAKHQEVLTEWILEGKEGIVATGGYLTHYNPPYADIFMAVGDAGRRRGYGSYIVQELCRTVREAGKIPAARCDPEVTGSRRALERGGLVVCGHLAFGEVVRAGS